MTKELAIKAPMDGEVDNPAMEAGDLVEADAVLLEMGSDQ